MPSSPRTFYKYRAFNTNTLESLCFDRLYFAHPGTFNDPLDCAPTVECDSNLNEQRSLLSALVLRRVKAEVLASLHKAKVKDDGAIAHAEERAKVEATEKLADIAYGATDPEYEDSTAETEAWLLTREIENELCRYFERGVCCLSTTYASPLLWSHYGDQHRGLCIGYGLNRKPVPKPSRVVYGGKRSVRTSLLLGALVHEDPAAQEQVYRDVLLRKARGWGYEKEWRLIGSQGDQESPLELKDITFGLRCPMSVRHAVAKVLDVRSEVRYFEMYVARGKFLIRRRGVDRGQLSAELPRTAMSGVEAFGEPEPFQYWLAGRLP